MDVYASLEHGNQMLLKEQLDCSPVEVTVKPGSIEVGHVETSSFQSADSPVASPKAEPMAEPILEKCSVSGTVTKLNCLDLDDPAAIPATLIAAIPTCPLRRIFYQQGYLILVTNAGQSHIFKTSFQMDNIGLEAVSTELPGQVHAVGRVGQCIAVALDRSIAFYDPHFKFIADLTFNGPICDVCFQGEWAAVCLECGQLIIIDSMGRVNGRRELEEPATGVRVADDSTVTTIAPTKGIIRYDVHTLGQVSAHDSQYAFDCLSLGEDGAVVGYLSGQCEFVQSRLPYRCECRVRHNLGRYPAQILGASEGTSYVVSGGLWAVTPCRATRFDVGNVVVGCLAGKGVFTYNGWGLSYYVPERWRSQHWNSQQIYV